VRAPRGSVLLVPDNYGSLVNNLYRPFMDDYLGADGYDVYDFWYGYPDNPAVLLASLQQFDVVVWLGGGATSINLGRATARGGVLEQYLPGRHRRRGRLLIVSGLTGAVRYSQLLRQGLGIGVVSSPLPELVPALVAVSAEAVSRRRGCDAHLERARPRHRCSRARRNSSEPCIAASAAARGDRSSPSGGPARQSELARGQLLVRLSTWAAPPGSAVRRGGVRTGVATGRAATSS
jgi:hypothetical protein